MDIDTSTPVLVLGGKENALSLVRHLGQKGMPISCSGPSNCWGMFSRYCQESFQIPYGRPATSFWRDLLLSEGSSRLHGYILLPCCDDAIEFVAEYNTHLATHYILDDGQPDLRQALLDKRQTLELARQAGIDAPQFWSAETDDDIEVVRREANFPLIVKPLHTYKFSRIFGQKFFVVEKDFKKLVEDIRLAQSHDLPVMVAEMIPGPDTLLSSYYTYIDKNGTNLFHFTKRILRRYPVNHGGACYHITEWLPETAELGRQFFERIGFTGLGNIEFKRDLRDGKLKIIEVNARFTAAQELIVHSGAPIDLIVYCHLTGQQVPKFSEYTQHLRYWYPLHDFLSFLEMRRKGDLTFIGWLKSFLPYRLVSPLHRVADPLPSFKAFGAIIEKIVRSRL